MVQLNRNSTCVLSDDENHQSFWQKRSLLGFLKIGKQWKAFSYYKRNFIFFFHNYALAYICVRTRRNKSPLPPVKPDFSALSPSQKLVHSRKFFSLWCLISRFSSFLSVTSINLTNFHRVWPSVQYMSLVIMPSTVRGKLDCICRNFLCDGSSDKRKMYIL